MSKQQVQLTRMVFADEIPSEVKRLLDLSLVSFSDNVKKYSEELTQLLEDENYLAFLERLLEFRMELMKADSLLEDCNGITKSYISILLDLEEEKNTKAANSHSHTHPHEHPHPHEHSEEAALLENMKEQLSKAEQLKESLENFDV